MLQDFHFKIFHRVGAKHANIDALSRNLVGNYEVDEVFGNEIQDLDRLTLEISMSSIAQGGEAINNLFIVMEVDATLDHIEDQTQKGNEITLYQDEEQDQRKNFEQQGPKYIPQGYWNLAHEAQTLVDKAKTKLVVKLEMDEDEQNHYSNIWEDPLSMKLLTGGSSYGNVGTPTNIEEEKRK